MVALCCMLLLRCIITLWLHIAVCYFHVVCCDIIVTSCSMLLSFTHEFSYDDGGKSLSLVEG